MYLVFNELSVHLEISSTISKEMAKQKINEFIEVLHLLKNKNLLQGIISTSDIHTFSISSNYGINEWLIDSSVKNTYKQFFRTLCSKRFTYIQAADFINEFIVLIDDKKYSGTGCLVATETDDSAIISIVTNKYWSLKKIYGQHMVIDNETTISSTERFVTNLSKRDDISIIENSIIKDTYDNISSGQDLWEQRVTLFPNLIFCDSVKDQLYKDPEKFHVLQIINRLNKLEQYFKTYNGIYSHIELGLNARTESDTVKSCRNLRNMRLFRKPNGEESYFFDHIGFSGKFSGGRIYFLPDDVNRICYIGYIGRHLPTKNY